MPRRVARLPSSCSNATTSSGATVARKRECDSENSCAASGRPVSGRSMLGAAAVAKRAFGQRHGQAAVAQVVAGLDEALVVGLADEGIERLGFREINLGHIGAQLAVQGVDTRSRPARRGFRRGGTPRRRPA